MVSPILEVARTTGVVPLFSNADRGITRKAVDASVEGARRAGIKQILFEYTCRPTGWQELLTDVAEHVDTNYRDFVILGAGSCLVAPAVDFMVSLGAKFIVSPRSCQKTADRCRSLKVDYMPAGEDVNGLYSAWEMLGEDGGMVKYYPSSRGPQVVKDALDPMGDGDFLGNGTKFPPLLVVATGLKRKDIEDLGPWFGTRSKAGGIIAVGGSSALFDAKEVEAGNWTAITDRAELLFRHAAEVKAKLAA